MNFIIPVISLTFCLHKSSQSPFVTLQLDGIQTLLHSIHPHKLDMSLNLERYSDNLCSLVQKSKIFNIQLKPGFGYQKCFEMNSRIQSMMPPPLITPNVKYKNPRSIENILQLVNDPHSFTEKKYLSLGRFENLSATACTLFDETQFYISNGTKIDNITFQFLFGRSEQYRRYPELLAVIGKPKLKILEKNVILDNISSKIEICEGRDVNKIPENWTHSLTELQRIWIGVTIADYESTKRRKNFKLDISYMLPNSAPFTLLINGRCTQICMPLMKFTLVDMDNTDDIKSILVVPDYFGNKSTYFYGIQNSRNFTTWRYVQIAFSD